MLCNVNNQTHIMKKTLIALVALTGVATAEVTDGWLTKPDALTWETLSITTPANGALSSSNSVINWTEETGNLEKSWELSFTLDPSRLSDQYLFGTVKDNSGAAGYTLSISSAGSIKLNQNKSTCVIEAKNAYTADDSAVAITLQFLNYVDEAGEDAGGLFTLTVGGSSYTYEIAEDDATNTVFTKGSNNNIFTNGGAETFSGISLKRGGNMIVPEPTTATLSLLALAGLAVRRRRK